MSCRYMCSPKHRRAQPRRWWQLHTQSCWCSSPQKNSLKQKGNLSLQFETDRDEGAHTALTCTSHKCALLWLLLFSIPSILHLLCNTVGLSAASTYNFSFTAVSDYCSHTPPSCASILCTSFNSALSKSSVQSVLITLPNSFIFEQRKLARSPHAALTQSNHSILT